MKHQRMVKAVRLMLTALMSATLLVAWTQLIGIDTPGMAQSVAARPQMDLRQTTGKLALLRVHDVGTRYGPPTDQIDVEVVINFENQPGKAYGFQLRDDAQGAARQGMLDLLRDAFNNNWTVGVDYTIDPGKNNGVIIRTWVTK